MLQSVRVRARRVVRQILHTGDPPERVARGLAAGFLATAFPLPGLQIPLSLLFAWMVRGNKAVSIFPQFISNAGTMIPIAYVQFRIGAVFWPGAAANVDQAMCSLHNAASAWVWSCPLESLHSFAGALASLGSGVVGPLSVGVLLSGFVAATFAYPVCLVGLTLFYSLRMRRRIAKGIAPLIPQGQFQIPDETYQDAGTMEAAAMRYVHNPAAFVRARQVKLLLDGRQAYPEMLAAIANATRSVDMGTYILRADRTGHRFAAALIAAAQRGVTVRLVYDGVGGMDLPQQYVNELLQGGVAVAVYRPISSLWLRGFGAINRRDHRKILVVDGTTAFTGGMNIGDEQAAKEDGGEGWRDTHCRVDGKEPAQQFLALLERGWQRADKFPPCSQTPGVHAAAVPAEGASALAANSVQCAAVSSDVSVQVLGNKEFIQRLRVRQAYLHAIKNAKRYILIENAYFIPDRRIRRALRAAVKRGVAVGVVTPMYSDLRIVAMASRALYGELLASGVRLFEYPISMLHCKAAVIDDLWSVVSSYNLDHRSLLHNLEAGVLLVDREIAQALRKQIVIDIANCREVTLELQKARPWNEALAESLAYQARYWL